MNQNTVYNFTIDAEHAGLRADGVLSQLFEEASRSYIQKLIESGCVFCDGKPMLSKKEKLKEGRSYAEIISARYSENYMNRGLELARAYQRGVGNV